MKLQPRKGRYFPIGVGKAAALTKGWGLYDRLGKRAPVSFQNPDARFRGQTPLVRLCPHVKLTVFSLPDDIDRPLAETAVIQAITLCAPLNEKPRFVTGHVVRSFVVFLTSLATLTVVERRTHFQQTKYRSGAKFSTAAKPRILRTEEMEVDRVSVQRVA